MAAGVTNSVSYSTVALAAFRFTVAFVTPGTLDSFFSTVRAQLAQVIPRTESFMISTGIPNLIFADCALARRIEWSEARNARDCAARRSGSAMLEAGGGIAVFLGAESPLTHAVGVGLNGPVREAELAGIEAFFRSRGAPVTLELSPLADVSIFQALNERGYRIAEFNNVMVRRLAGYEIALTPRVSRALAGESDLWAHTLGHGFFEKPELTEPEMDIGRDLFAMPGAICYLACVDGETTAGAALVIRDGLATLCADGTIAAFRRRGLQSELILARLNEAAAQGCDLATASTLPGSQSQRNYERVGFQVAYTKVTLTG
jgi:GNAT superfamily N-acetyltransferase